METRHPVCRDCGDHQTRHEAGDRWQCENCGCRFNFSQETGHAPGEGHSSVRVRDSPIGDGD